MYVSRVFGDFLEIQHVSFGNKILYIHRELKQTESSIFDRNAEITPHL